MENSDPPPGEASSGAVIKRTIYIPEKGTSNFNYLGLLIGPKGAKQRQLQEMSGAKVHIRGRGASKTNYPEDRADPHVTVEGTEEAVEMVCREIEEIISNPEKAQRVRDEQMKLVFEEKDQRRGPYVRQLRDGSYELEMFVPNSVVGLVIGRGGENIHRIQSALGVDCDIAKEPNRNGTRTIMIRGKSSRYLHDAKRRIDDIADKAPLKPKSSTSDDQPSGSSSHAPPPASNTKPYVIKVAVPNDKIGLVVGKGGSVINGIQDKTRTSINVPSESDEGNPTMRSVIVSGDSQQSVLDAQMEILRVVQERIAANRENNASAGYAANELRLSIPDHKVGVVVGRSGTTIKSLEERFHVKINIPTSVDPGSNPPQRTAV